jgi:hypothetical protein
MEAQMLPDLLGAEAVVIETEDDVMASLASSTDVRGVVAVEYDILCLSREDY